MDSTTILKSWTPNKVAEMAVGRVEDTEGENVVAEDALSAW
jgi:hypothetical protein